jgi:hypothetical protein
MILNVQVRFDYRRRWILEWLRAEKSRGASATCDVLNQDFSDKYLVATGAKCMPTAFGAHKCPQLGRDLSRMNAEGSLVRKRVSICGMAGQGFPKWAWVYELAQHLQ